MPIENKTAVTDHLVLGTWEAIALLDQAQERCSEPDVAELLAEAEAILTSLVLKMPALARAAGGPDRGNGFALLGETARAAVPEQEPFDYRPQDRRSQIP